MSASLMGRLFVVPAVIVCVLLGVAVVVVLFGTTTIDKPVTVAVLLDRIESSSGTRQLGMMLPQAKDSWQAAQELAQRFAEKDKYVEADEIEPAAQRIAKMLERQPPRGAERDGEGGPELLARHLFLISALGRLETPTAVPVLKGLLRDPDWDIRRTALSALASMNRVPEARAALPDVIQLLSDESTAVQIVACAALAGIADGNDAAAKSMAASAVAERLDAPREVQWNAAMTLARLGDSRGRLVLMNMLDRSYWEKIDLEYDENGSTIRRKYAPAEIEHNLRSAIEAAALLADTELRGLIEKLAEDPSVGVRAAARAAMSQRLVGCRSVLQSTIAC